jgi:hypothetical protein
MVAGPIEDAPPQWRRGSLPISPIGRDGELPIEAGFLIERRSTVKVGDVVGRGTIESARVEEANLRPGPDVSLKAKNPEQRVAVPDHRRVRIVGRNQRGDTRTGDLSSGWMIRRV